MNYVTRDGDRVRMADLHVGDKITCPFLFGPVLAEVTVVEGQYPTAETPGLLLLLETADDGFVTCNAGINKNVLKQQESA